MYASGRQILPHAQTLPLKLFRESEIVYTLQTTCSTGHTIRARSTLPNSRGIELAQILHLMLGSTPFLSQEDLPRTSIQTQLVLSPSRERLDRNLKACI